MIKFAIDSLTWIFSQDIFGIVVGSGMLLTFLIDILCFLKAVR